MLSDSIHVESSRVLQTHEQEWNQFQIEYTKYQSHTNQLWSRNAPLFSARIFFFRLQPSVPMCSCGFCRCKFAWEISSKITTTPRDAHKPTITLAYYKQHAVCIMTWMFILDAANVTQFLRSPAENPYACVKHVKHDVTLFSERVLAYIVERGCAAWVRVGGHNIWLMTRRPILMDANLRFRPWDRSLAIRATSGLASGWRADFPTNIDTFYMKCTSVVNGTKRMVAQHCCWCRTRVC